MSCGNPDPTEEFEPHQRPLRGQVVRGRYVPLGTATRERASSAPAQSRRCGAPGGARRRRVLNDRVDTSRGNATEWERRSRWRLPEPPLTQLRFPPRTNAAIHFDGRLVRTTSFSENVTYFPCSSLPVCYLCPTSLRKLFCKK